MIRRSAIKGNKSLEYIIYLRRSPDGWLCHHVRGIDISQSVVSHELLLKVRAPHPTMPEWYTDRVNDNFVGDDFDSPAEPRPHTRSYLHYLR